jgi:hypothetical protein
MEAISIMMSVRNTGLSLLLLLLSPMHVYAGCGSAFCPLNTQWEVQGAWTEPGTRLDLRFEYIDQDQPQHGSDEVAVGEIPGHHDEIRTINRNALLTVDHAFSNEWSLSATLPLLDRRHEHIHNHHEPDGHVEQFHERWNYSQAGDLRLLASYRPHDRDAGLLFGAKLPTGATDIANNEGVVAERMLQPGSGTTDILFGGFYRHQAPSSALSWFARFLWQNAIDEQDAYKPGRHISVDTGLRYDGGSSLDWMLQLNLVHKASDDGNEAEPENSGGVYAFLSPGLSLELGDSMQLYTFLQQSLYQDVTGVQLTAGRSLVTGISSRF